MRGGLTGTPSRRDAATGPPASRAPKIGRSGEGAR